MDKQMARDIMLIYACCSNNNVEKRLCNKCPLYNTKDCNKGTIDKKILSEAIVTINCIN